MKDFLITTINFMKNYKSLSNILCTIIAINIAIVSTFTSCVKADDTLGGNLVPNDKEMVVGVTSLDNAELFETRLYQTDSVVMSNLTSGYIGAMRDDTTGLRTAGLFTQFRPFNKVDSGYFGYRPFMDSVQLLLNIISTGSDTLTTQKFNVYEITDNKYLADSKDSIFYLNFDPIPYIDEANPLFTFELPNGVTNNSGPIGITLDPTEKGRHFIQRLMISNGDKGEAGYVDPKVDYKVYDTVEDWLKTFKGLYVVPQTPTWSGPESKGTIFTTNLISTVDAVSAGFVVYGRNRDVEDPTLIKDTVGCIYTFYNAHEGKTLHTINTIERDYQGSEINIADAVETNKDRPETEDIYVDGMGGVTTEITFGKNFFDAIEAIIEKENIDKKEDFKSIAFNRADMKFYFSAADHNWENISASQIYPLMDGSIDRLGLYNDFKDLTGVVDYYYSYEISQEAELAFGGYINRSHGCYTLNICAYLQAIWNSYLELKENGGTIKYEDIENSSVYLAPAVYVFPATYNLFTTKHAKLQGHKDADGKQNTMKIDLVYTLIK